MSEFTAAGFFRQVANTLERHDNEPHGPAVVGDERQIAGDACKQLCGGDADKARSLWKLIAEDLGYMPRAAAVALIRASTAESLIPDVEAPAL